MNFEDSQKLILIVSMQKLIKYVQISKQNQWEIFQSLSRQDILKIISNFSDQNHKLRKLSLTLLGILLNGNNSLKQRLCERMEAASIPGKICLNFNLISKYSFSIQKIQELLGLLKVSVNKQDQNFPIWMISLRNIPLKLDFIPISALNYIDPNENLVGFTLIKEQKQSPKKAFFNIFETFLAKEQKLNTKSMFKVAPSTTRNTSPCTQHSHRFNRTNNPKTSIKQSLKSSLVESLEKNIQKQSIFTSPRYINQSQKFKSQCASPKKMMFQSNKNDQYFSKFKEPPQIQDEISTAPTNQQISKYQPIINNTYIYINTPVDLIQAKDKQNQPLVYSHKKYEFFRQSCLQTCRNSPHKQSIYFQNETKLCQQSNPIQPNLNILINNSKKYQRVTRKTVNQSKQAKNFNFDHYRKFVNTVCSSIKQSKILDKN